MAEEGKFLQNLRGLDYPELHVRFFELNGLWQSSLPDQLSHQIQILDPGHNRFY